ncbi:MAG: hypothetical protein V2I35_09530 [Desulfocapsaceae bacterium]|nr:hypothetical protein [Desulfocapsaceae bacterium]
MILLAGGCRQEDKPEEQAVHTAAGCAGCHAVELDRHHQFACIECHRGVDGTEDRQAAHQGLVKQPSHPDNAEQFCQRCHRQETAMVVTNDHYTLNSHIELVRNAFSPAGGSVSLDDVQASAAPDSVLQLVDDLLRRRCLRCHVYSEGDELPATKRASGCGSCHLEYYGGTMVSHHFLEKPDNSNCLSCHYGNHVGFDFYGRFEHDFNEEYRTPYTTREDYFRPYGVEYHQLEADVHHRGGMICLDCHDRDQVMGNSSTGRTCASCHDREHLENSSSRSITRNEGKYRFTSTATGKTIALPVMVHPAHQKYATLVSCQGCHALWAFYDDETHLLRIDHDELDEFEKLTRDGSSEVRRILASHMEFDGEWLEPEMKDQLNNELFPGIWLKGYKERRWENIHLVPDSDGLFQVGRPLLDLHLSWINEEGFLQFDNITIDPGISPLVPYAPHTIGKAGSFFEKRLTFLNDAQKPAPDQPTDENR